jgi:hypothetical protein
MASTDRQLNDMDHMDERRNFVTESVLIVTGMFLPKVNCGQSGPRLVFGMTIKRLVGVGFP